jgi:MFS family permease
MTFRNQSNTAQSTGIFQRLSNIPTFRAFHFRNFPFLFITTITLGIGDNMMMVAQGWLVLNLTNSPLSLGLVFATRALPHLLFGLLAGSVADRFNRKALLIVVFFVAAAVALVMGILTTTGLIQLWHILVLLFIFGIAATFDSPARQAFVVDIVGRENTMNALSINAVGMRVIGIIGGAAAGFVIEYLGVDWAFYIKLATYIVGIGLLLCIVNVHRQATAKKQSFKGTFVEGLRIIGTNRIILVLMVMAAVAEMFGFSRSVLLPVFARDVLKVGAIGYGWFSTAASVGGLLALVCLASLGNYKHKGRLILTVFLFFGIGLILFAQSRVFGLSLVFLGLIGAMAGSHDALQHILLQLNVTEEQRGRAMGAWQLSIGFGPLGTLSIGALANAIGAQAAQTIFGMIMVVLVAVLFTFVPRLKNI